MSELRLLSLPLLLAGVLASSAGAATDEPILVRDEQRRLVLTRLPPLLAEEEVERQLTTGLTTTLVFRLDLPNERDGRGAGGAVVEIRYELWDEEFLVRTLTATGERHHHQISTMEELQKWWSEMRLVLLGPRPLAAGEVARVSLDVVPFSRSEQLDTQRWLSDSVSRADGAGAVEEEGASLGRVFRVLIATSIQRRPVLTFRWNLTLPVEEAP